MNDFWEVCILSAAQGVAEFLPISSSGHLLVLGSWFKFDVEKSMTLNVVLHAGTLLSILVFYFRKLLSIICDPQRRRLILLVAAGSAPAAFIGVILKITGWDERLFGSPWIAAAGFAFTGFMLFTVFRKTRSGVEDPEAIPAEKMSFLQALLIGCAQAVAITPGISRSGSTISCGILNKLRKSDAAEFSFLLAIPAIGGAALLELLKIVKSPQSIAGGELYLLIMGFVISAAVGYIALAGLIALLKKGRLDCFAYYLFAAAVLTAVLETVKLL